MCDRRRQLEEWKKRRASQGIGRSSLGGGAARQAVDARRGSLPASASLSGKTTPGASAGGSASRSRLGASAERDASSGRKSRFVRQPLAPENVSERRRKPSSSLGASRSASGGREREKKSASAEKTKTSAGKRPPEVSIRRGLATHETPSPPAAMRASGPPASASPPDRTMVPSPEAVSAFMASLRAAEAARHSPGVGAAAPASRAVAHVHDGSPPGENPSTPKSGVSTTRPHAAAVAAFALSRRGSSALASASREAREKERATRAEMAALEEKLRATEGENSKLESDVAVLGMQMSALEASGEASRRAAEAAKAEAAEASKALAAAKASEAAAVEEREFTIEAQAGMLQQLSGELERAEKSREEAEKSRAERDATVAELKAECDRVAKELARRNHQAHMSSSGGGGAHSDAGFFGGFPGRESLGGVSSRRSSGAGAGASLSKTEEDRVRAAESVARQSQERLLELVAARQAAERDAADANAHARRWEAEVGKKREDLELMQEEMERCLAEERRERRRAEEAYADARETSERLERLVERRAEEMDALEEKLKSANASAEASRAACAERDALLRDGASMLEAKESELDEAATYALQLQQQLERLEAERERLAALEAAGTPAKAERAERVEAREALVRSLKAEHEAATASAERELEALRHQLRERDSALANSASELAGHVEETRRLERELRERGSEMSPMRDELAGALAQLAEMRGAIDERDARVAQIGEELRKAMSAEKRQTEKTRRLEVSLSEREEMVRTMNERLRDADRELRRAEEDHRERDASRETRHAERERELGERLRSLEALERAEATARMKAEALAAEVAKEETQRARLVEDLAAAEDALDAERERNDGRVAEAEERLAQLEAAHMERVAELEGRILQIQTEADQRVEEAEARRDGAREDLEAALAAATEELESHKMELKTAHEALAATEHDRRRRRSLEARETDARRAVADAEKRCAEAQSAHAEAEARSVSLEAEVARLSSALASERKHTKMSMETAAKAHLRKEEAFAAETRALGAKLHAAEARVAASDGEAKRLATELESIRGDETRRVEEALAAAEEKAAAAEADAEDAREKADLTEKESLFFLGEMQTAVAEAEKKIIALHKTVASRDVKLAAADAEVRALKNAVRAHEAKLADGEKLYRARLAAALEERGAKHAEELESARGEVEGNAVMLEMENEQLLKNLDEKRVKIRALQAEHARATEKMRRLRDEAENAKAAEAEAERRRAEAERARDELADRLATEAADATKTTTTPGGSVGHKARFEALARAMWNRGTRPGDLDGDAASALESFGVALEAAATRARGPPTASTPKSKILEMTQAAQKVSFSRIRASVEAKKADIKRRSSLGLDNASTELASLRRTIATMMEGSSSAKKDKTDNTPGPSETPETAARGAPRPKRASMMARMTFGDSPSPAPASERRSARATAASGRENAAGPGQENAAPDATRAASKPTRLSDPEKRSRRSSAMAQRRQALRNLQSQVQAAAR